MTQSLGNVYAATAALRVTGAGAPLHVEEIGRLKILHSTQMQLECIACKSCVL